MYPPMKKLSFAIASGCSLFSMFVFSADSWYTCEGVYALVSLHESVSRAIPTPNE